MGRDWKSLEMHVRKSLDCSEEIAVRNMDVKGDSDEASEDHISVN